MEHQGFPFTGIFDHQNIAGSNLRNAIEVRVLNVNQLVAINFTLPGCRGRIIYAVVFSWLQAGKKKKFG
ncbi:MAG: hypothetical protein KGM98_15515 [Bacteroidota bacterium]|nr:hypothetical protein [Bacteroidota bacterium]